MRTTPSKHRPNRGSAAVKLDPYALDDTTITLEQWRRLQAPLPARARCTPATRRPRRRAG